MRYADERAHDALEENRDVSCERAFRDRAIVYLLGLSGVRGAEVFSEPSDDKRTGITWGDVELEAGESLLAYAPGSDMVSEFEKIAEEIEAQILPTEAASVEADQ